MAIARFHSIRGEKSALILVKANPLEFSFSPVYVPREGIKSLTGTSVDETTEEFEFKIPDGFKLVPIVDVETGEVRTTKDGQPLHQLSYS